MILYIIYFILAITVYSFISKNRKFSNQDPKGPLNLPFVGALLSLGSKPHITYTKWNRKYGGIIKLWLGNSYSMVISDPAIMKEIWLKDFKSYSDRPKFPTLRKFSYGFEDLAMTDYQNWKERRELVALYFTKSKLKNSVPIIDENCENLIRLMSKYAQSQEPICVNKYYQKYALNIILNYVFSQHIPYDEDVNSGYLKKLNEPVYDVISLLTTGGLMDYFYILELIFEVKNKFTTHGFDVLFGMMQEIYEKHESSIDPENPKDIIDHLILNLHVENKKKVITLMSLNMFLAGFDTSTSALEWLTLTLANRQEIQEKVYRELEEVAAGSGKITLAHRTQTPYLNAVLKEIFRYRTLIPLGIPRIAHEDSIVGGYYIPKGTVLYNNMYEVHNNPVIYDKPEEFNPDRFLVEDHRQEWMPFSLGPRNCVGMNLGLDKVYVGAANILLNFHIKPHNCDKYEYDDAFGLTLRPDKDYPMTLTFRSQMAKAKAKAKSN